MKSLSLLLWNDRHAQIVRGPNCGRVGRYYSLASYGKDPEGRKMGAEDSIMQISIHSDQNRLGLNGPSRRAFISLTGTVEKRSMQFNKSELIGVNRELLEQIACSRGINN